MPTFKTVGPFVVPTYAGKAAKIIRAEEVSSFWIKHDAFGSDRGCYIFCIRAGKGFKPIYVGKATRTFQQEVFTPRNLTRYLTALADIRSGTPVLFFLLHPRGKGATNKKAIGRLEVFLIQTGIARNPDLMNVQNTKQEDWGIAGVLRSGQGQPSVSAKGLKRMLRL